MGSQHEAPTRTFSTFQVKGESPNQYPDTYYGSPSELGGLAKWKQDTILRIDRFIQNVVAAAEGNLHANALQDFTAHGEAQYLYAIREMIAAQHYLRRNFGIDSNFLSINGHAILTWMRGRMVVRITFQKSDKEQEAIKAAPPSRRKRALL